MIRNGRLQLVRISGFEIDASISEQHDFNAEVTSHPVEDGADITDHVRNLPISIALECVVSDTPIGIIAEHRSTTSRPSDDAYGFLKLIRDTREPVTIETSLEVFESMVLTTLSIPKEAGTGDALKFNVSFTQVQIITNERTVLRTAAPRGQNKQNRGNKPLKPMAVAATALKGTRTAINNFYSIFGVRNAL